MNSSANVPVYKGSNPNLLRKIKYEINRSQDQSISFSDFMALALYEPEYGYYASTHQQLGPMGDFVTSSHLTQDYGELIGAQLIEFWQVLGQPSLFTVVEMGPGQGLISVDALTYLVQGSAPKEMITALQWKLVETSESLIRWQQHYFNKRLSSLFAHADIEVPIEWTTLDSLQREHVCGCMFSNELVDAFPFHLLQFREGRFNEVFLTLGDEECIQEKLMPLSDELAEYLDQMIPAEQKGDYSDGYRCEINLAVKDWITKVGVALREGYLLTIDYGYSAEQLYSPARQSGTLQCYTQQKSHDDPYANIGNQDITSHVNFTALELFGQSHGIERIGMTQQGLFLMALGLGDRLNSNNANADLSQLNSTLQRREALHALINPMGLGGFKVLLQGKGLTQAQKDYPYQGFQTGGPLF